MERLQAAIEKARAQRRDTAPKPGEPRKPATGPAPAADEAWAALDTIRLDEKQLHRHRITAFEGGPEGAAYDMLRTKMLQQARKHGWRRVALVSPHSNCGKSTTAANLAFSLSRQHNLRSLVLDFDLRRSGLTRILGQKRPTGMARVLEGKATFSESALRYGANVGFGLSSTARVETPAEILQNPQTQEALERIEHTYQPDVVLFDMPPLMASDDNFGFLHNVDCALILVAAEKTNMKQIDIAERQISELTSVMGIVLTKCRYTSSIYDSEYDYYY